MSYQPKTTIITIMVGKWTEESDSTLTSRFSALRAIAVQIATCCQMDIMNIAYQSMDEEECIATVIYVNNGHSFEDIRSIMAPEINNRPQKYWMILDIYEWQGMLDCVVTTRGTNEEWS